MVAFPAIPTLMLLDFLSVNTLLPLTSLIPLGLALETAGTAKWIAEQTLLVAGEMQVCVIRAAVAVPAAFFALGI